MTVAQYLAQWLETACRPAVRDSTWANYETQIRVHINPRIGGVRLSEFRPWHVQSMLSGMQRDGKSSRVRRLTYVVLNRAVGQALKWGMITRNPCTAVDAPRYKAKEMKPLTVEQVKAFLTAARGDRIEALYTLAVATGMRQGELLGLKWEDIDFKNATLQVRRSVSLLRGRPTVGEPKTQRARRRIHLSPLALAAPGGHRRRALANGHATAPWMFSSETGGLVNKNNMVRRSFKPLLGRAGLPDIRFHDLRHTAATLMFSTSATPRLFTPFAIRTTAFAVPQKVSAAISLRLDTI